MSEKIQNLLQKAETLMMKDASKEAEILRNDPYAQIDTEKYSDAQDILNEVLSIDNSNKIAQDLLAKCEQMLIPRYAVQYMAPPPCFEDMEFDNAAIVVEEPRTQKSLPPDERMPWEIAAEGKAYDEKCMKYTSDCFSEACNKARKQVKQMVQESSEQIQDGADAASVQLALSKSLEDFQYSLRAGWKGHGPEIMEYAEELKKEYM